MKKIIFLILLALVIFNVYKINNQNIIIPNSSIRLRVIPNSNNPEDISIKEKVKKGDAIMHLDLDYLKNHTETISSPIICTDASDNMDIKLLASGKVKALEPLFDIYFYR